MTHLTAYRTKLDTCEAFSRKKNYNPDFIKLNTHANTEPNETTNNPTTVTTATIPYMKGTSETIARILQSYVIRVAHKPITTTYHDDFHGKFLYCFYVFVLLNRCKPTLILQGFNKPLEV